MGQRRLFLMGASSVAALLAAASPSFAQDAAPKDSTQVKEVVVTGIRSSLQKAINIQRNSDDIVDAISAEDIGKLPDRNVADALQRIPGVNTFSAASGEGGFDENDRVSIRGTPPSLTQVTVDGHDISTGDWFILDQFQTVGRSVSFTLLPSEIVNNIVVDKSQNASLLEGGVAGSIDIQTRKPLDFNKMYTAEVSLEGAYNSLSGTTKPQFSGLLGWKSSDGTLGILAQGFYEQRDVRRYGQEVLGYSPLGAGTPLGTAHPSLVGVEYPTLIGSALFEQQRTREGGDFVIQWKPSDQFELKFDAFYSDMNATNHNDNYMFWGTNEFGNNLPTSYTVKNNTFVAANFPLVGPGGGNVNGLVVDNIVRPNAEARTMFFNLDGKFRVNDKLSFTGQIGYTEGLGFTPQSPSFEVEGVTGGSYAPSGNGFATNFPNINPQSSAGLANDWAWNEQFKSLDKEFYTKVDGDYVVGDGVLKDVKFGVRYAEHSRQVDGWDRGCSIGGATNDCWGSPSTPFSAVNPTSYPSGYSGSALGIPGLVVPLAGNPGSIVSVIDGIANSQRGSIAHTVQPINYYWLGSFKVQEDDWAGYAMAKLGGDRWKATVGIRVVDTNEQAFVNSPSPTSASSPYITTSAFGNYYVNDVQHNYLDALPSLNASYRITDDLVLRGAIAKAMSRPDYSALGGTVSLTDLTLSGQGGNANLKPIRSTNYDASLAWYYGKLSNVVLDVFYMDLQSYIDYGISSQVYKNQLLSGQSGPAVYSTYQISAPINIAGQVQGFEIAWQTPIKYGFGFLANYAYSDGETTKGTPLIGDSKDTVNVTGYYENKWLSARLAYTYKTKVYVGIDRSSAEVQDPTESLDAAVNVKVTPNLSLTLQGLNLTDHLLRYTTGNPSQPRATYENGTQVYFGLRAKF